MNTEQKYDGTTAPASTIEPTVEKPYGTLEISIPISFGSGSYYDSSALLLVNALNAYRAEKRKHLVQTVAKAHDNMNEVTGGLLRELEDIDDMVMSVVRGLEDAAIHNFDAYSSRQMGTQYKSHAMWDAESQERFAETTCNIIGHD